MKIRFTKMLEELGLQITEKQYKQFEIYYQTLIEWNQKMNLTAITEQDDVYIKHFYDSLCIVKTMDFNSQTLLDVGSGAGFPSIPLKIMYPDLDITIIDALQKRITFLTELTKKLDVEAQLIHGRAEEFERKHCYDVVTARAVANLQMLSELCIPFVKIGGTFIALKGSKHEAELSNSIHAIKTLGGQYKTTIEYEVEGQNRGLIIVEKKEKTKKEYPRIFSKIKKNPL